MSFESQFRLCFLDLKSLTSVNLFTQISKTSLSGVSVRLSFHFSLNVMDSVSPAIQFTEQKHTETEVLDESLRRNLGINVLGCDGIMSQCFSGYEVSSWWDQRALNLEDAREFPG